MPFTPQAILSDPNVLIGLQEAWTDSRPGTGGGHEEGGFIVRGETDKRAVTEDPDLKGVEYVGEFVISETFIFLISPSGQVREMDATKSVFNK